MNSEKQVLKQEQPQQKQQQQQVQKQQLQQSQHEVLLDLKSSIEKLYFKIDELTNNLHKLERKFGTSDIKVSLKDLEHVFKNPESYYFNFMNGMTIGDLIRNKVAEKVIDTQKFCSSLHITDDRYKALIDDKVLPGPKESEIMAKLLQVGLSDLNVCKGHTYQKMKITQTSEWRDASSLVEKDAEFYSALLIACRNNEELFPILAKRISDYLDKKTTPDSEIMKAKQLIERGLKARKNIVLVRRHYWKAIRLALSAGDKVKVISIGGELKNFLLQYLKPEDNEIKEIDTIFANPEKCIEIVEKAKGICSEKDA